MLDEHIDTGGILFQKEVGIMPDEDAGSLYSRLMTEGAALVLETVDAVASGTAAVIPQNAEGLSPERQNAPKLDRQTGLLDWNGDAGRLRNLVRGLSPRPGAHGTVLLDGQPLELKIYAADAVSEEEAAAAGVPEDVISAAPGAVYTDRRSCIMIRCAEGLLSVRELQAPGKKRMDVRSFLAGWRGTER